MKEIYSLSTKKSSTPLEESPCCGVENVTIIVHKKYIRNKKRKKFKSYKEPDQLIAVLSTSDKRPPLNVKEHKRTSVPTLVRYEKESKMKDTKSEIFPIKENPPFRSDYVVNVMSERKTADCMNPLPNPLIQPQWRIYRCQLNTQEESCCCSCNSDAMFEVMKSLYDCYKKKNCDHCNCILCGHLPREERRLGEMRKTSGPPSSIAVATVAEKERRKDEIKRLEKEIKGKSPEEKAQILEKAAMAGAPLPEGKTPSEKELIKTIKTKLGLPQEPKTAAEKERLRQAEAAGLIVPLEGKSPSEKEKILRKQAEMGLPLPEGRTPSEKALIDKIKKSLPSVTAVHPSKLKKAKEAGVLTPLEGKTPEQKEKILRGLAEHGIPLPSAKTASEKKLIEKVRKDMGLPPEPSTPKMKEQYRKAAAAGLLTPLEGKTPAQKEKILKGQAELGLPLPEGRTPSEKALIDKVKATVKPIPSHVPTEKYRKAKEAGVLTPLEGKSPEQKEKILKGLAKHGIPLPEGKTPSEKDLINKVRKEMGLPPEPKTPSMKEKHKKAAAAGLLTPLEGKTPEQKEKILTGQAQLGLPLPEGRTPSEKALIDKIKATVKPHPSVAVPLEKIRKAKAAGLLTPLAGKTPEQKEHILKGLAEHGIPLPEAKSPSEQKIIDKVRADLGLPPEPSTPAGKEKYKKAVAAGLITPLEGKTPAQKEKILKGQAEMGLPLPEGRTPSEKALIEKVKATVRPPSEAVPASEKMRKAKAAGLLTPLTGKTPEQKENIIKGLAMHGLPLPEAKTPSEKKLVDKIRADLGLPPEPKTPAEKDKYEKAQAAGLIVPLEGKTPAQKEKILKDMANHGIPLPEGRTPSEKALVAKVKAARREPPLVGIPSERIKNAKAAGLLTPLEGKTPEQREDILKGLAMHGIPLPLAQTPSEKKMADKVRAELGLPPEPKTPEEKEKYDRAMAAGVILPLEGKTPEEKEKILHDMADMGIPLPEGRTPSEKAIINKVKAVPRPAMIHPSKLQKARAAGLLTPLEGKTPAQKEKILKGLAMHGIPLPEGKSPSEKKLIEKTRNDLGLPPEPKTSAEKVKYAKAAAAGLLVPLEGKTPEQKEKILNDLADMGVPLPIGRTPSEKALIAKVKAAPRAPPIPSDRLKKAKAAGLLTPLEGKTPAQKENIIKGLAMHGIPLPEGKTPSEKKIIEKVRADLGMPPEPKTPEEKEKYAKALAAGLITPLEGKTPAEKEKILKGMADMGIPLPAGRTPSEKAMIENIKKAAPRRKTRMGRPALPPEEAKKLDEMTLKVVKEGKGPVDECICDILTPEAERPVSKVPLKVASEKLRAAKAAGLLTPLEGKTPQQKEKILKGLAKHGIPLPEGKTPSEKKLIDKVRADMGLPPEPKTASAKQRYAKAQAAGLVTPLEGKTAAQKEKILRGQAELGLPLPEGRTPSEKALVNKVKAAVGIAPSGLTIPSEKIRKAKEAGLLTPLEGKTPEQKEKILRGRVAAGLPLPEGRTPSEKKLIKKVKAETGYISPVGKTPSEKEMLRKAKAAGLLTPLEGKPKDRKMQLIKDRIAAGLPIPEGTTPSEKQMIKKLVAAAPPPSLKGKTLAEKEKILRSMTRQGRPLPEGKTPSEKALIEKVKRDMSLAPPFKGLPSEKVRKAKAAGLLTPLEGKSPEQKEKILKGLAKAGIPLPEGKTDSDKKLIRKVRDDLGLPPEPKTPSMKEKLRQAYADGIITPLEGKSPAEKEKILKRMHDHGLALPEGKTPSEKELVRKVQAMPRSPPPRIPSEKIRAAKAAGFLTPLEGKTPAEKEKILKGLAKSGLPLPEGKTTSEKELIKKVRTEMGLPPPPKTPKEQEKMLKAHAAGLITPLEGKTPAQKEKILKGLAEAGIPLPEGRTPSEKKLIDKVKTEVKAAPSVPSRIPSEKLRKAKAAGLLTPLDGKSPEEKERILRGLADAGLPLPEGKTKSEKSLINKVRAEHGIPIATTTSEKEVLRRAKVEGLLTPLTGKTPAEKERILKGLADAGLPLPVGKTPSEKALVKKVRAAAGLPSEPTPSEKAGKIKKKGKKVGVSASAKAAGIAEELEDITKTTVCDRACGCDKKKIRFKHSYVKIRVTSPDISSLCPCPDECIPGVKHGVFTDNEGIKVTVGSAVGVPSLLGETSSKTPNSLFFNHGYTSSNSVAYSASLTSKRPYNVPTSLNLSPQKEVQRIFYSPVYSNDSTESFQSLPKKVFKNQAEQPCMYDYTYQLKAQLLADYSRNSSSISDTAISHRSSQYLSVVAKKCFESRETSFNSILIIKTESSLSLSTDADITTISVISIDETTNPSQCSHYLCYSNSETNSADSFRDAEYLRKLIKYTKKITTSKTNITYGRKSPTGQRKLSDVLIFRMSHVNLKDNEEGRKSGAKEPIVVISYLNSDQDVTRMVDEILSQKLMADASSIFVVVPTAERDLEESRFSSTIGIEMSKDSSTCDGLVLRDDFQPDVRMSTIGFKFSKKGKQRTCNEMSTDKMCQAKLKRKVDARMAGTDTTTDRPCCCTDDAAPKVVAEVHHVNSVVSELITPLIENQGVAQGLSQEAYKNNPGMYLRVAPPHRVQVEPTQVKHCVVPPGHTGCHDGDNQAPATQPIREDPLPTRQDNCSCTSDIDGINPTPSNVKKGFSIGIAPAPKCPYDAPKMPKDTTPPRVNNKIPVVTPIIRSTGNAYCPTCGQPTMIDNKKYSCLCKGKEKKVRLPPPRSGNPQDEKLKNLRSVGCQCCLCDEQKTIKKQNPIPMPEPKTSCPCSHKKKENRKVICECPPEEFSEYQISEPEITDEKQNIIMKSDLTQTTSGFRINKKKKPPEEQLSFEEALRYYKAFIDEDAYDMDVCSCDTPKKRVKKKEVECECPYEPEPETETKPEEEPFRGLKFAIGGKGSGSKGLSGICCFDMIQQSNVLINTPS